MATLSQSIRRGLPRVEGAEPWPPAHEDLATAPPARVDTQVQIEPSPTQGASGTSSPPALAASETAPLPSANSSGQASMGPVTSAGPDTAITLSLRRGLPRIPGGDSWPAAGEVTVMIAARAESPATETPTAAELAQSPAPPAVVHTSPNATGESASADAPSRRRLGAAGEAVPPAVPQVSEPAQTKSARDTGTAGGARTRTNPRPKTTTTPKVDPKLYGSRTLGRWIKLAAVVIGGAVAAAAILVLAAKGVTTLPGVPEFLRQYPGEYHLPDVSEAGFPWWARWTHFLNFFLMVLIIRSGYQVRTQQKPPAFWTPKRGGKKISINLWLHQSLDILWLANGLIFVVLLFISGHWMRIVPTSWEVFPNALSALLQYMTLDWPTENGWVNYNSLQQIMYFLVVFVAAPLSAITGVRMSELWPKNAKALNRIFPVEAARAIHFPTMIFFVLFILIHVFLVFATGALRNLNHMYAGTDVINWTGFWFFSAAIAVTLGAWFAARPLVLAPLAKLFGQVSSR
jgi:thiosulfate reductase cytochrome b subunit